MTSRPGLLTGPAVLLLLTAPTSAQFFVPFNPYAGLGINYTRVTPNSVLHIGLGTRSIYSPWYGPPFAPGFVGPWGNNIVNQTTVIVNPAGIHPLTGWPVFPRGPIVDPLALEVLPRGFLDGLGNPAVDREIDRIRESLPRPLPDPNRGLLSDREEDRIQVKIDRPSVLPRDPVPPLPPPVRPVAPAPKVEVPPPAFPPLPPPVRPVAPAPKVEVPPPAFPPLPLDNAQAEYLRLVTDGKVAFGKGDYGRAAERFSQAIAKQPAETAAWFLRSQAGVALGKYLDAATDLREGLRRMPEGLVAGFSPTDIYGEKAAEYPEHRKLLEQTRERFAGDPHLALLAAVQCWLAGEKAAAVARMEKLVGNDRLLVEKFVQAAPRVAAAP